MLKHLRVSAKLTLIVAPIILLAIVILVFYSKLTITLVQESKQLLYDKVYVSSAAIINADRDFYQAALAQNQLSGNGGNRQALVTDYRDNAQQVKDRMSSAIENIKGDKDLYEIYKHPSKNVNLKELYESFTADYELWYGSFDPETGKGDIKAHTAAFGTAREHLNLMTEILETYAEEASAKQISDAMRNNNSSFIVICIIILVIVVFAVRIVIYLRSNIVKLTKINKRIADGELTIEIDNKKPARDEIGQLKSATVEILGMLNNYANYIKEVTDILNNMAEGNLRFTLKYDYNGEFIHIKNALLSISSSLGSVLGLINNTAEEVNRGAMQISNGAQALSQGSTEQAAAVEELSATIEGLAEQSDKNNINVNTASETLQNIMQSIDLSSRQMEEMLRAMQTMSDNSKNIKSIINLIDSIAFQTNILSLNAAVEAARAGESGKGFAVVAGEVKTLAGKSAEAASKTADMIEQSLRSVEKGITITNSTAQALTSVFDNIKLTNRVFEDISDSTKTQSVTINEIKTGIGQISQVVAMNNATAEESAASSEELSAQAERLYSEVSRFKV